MLSRERLEAAARAAPGFADVHAEQQDVWRMEGLLKANKLRARERASGAQCRASPDVRARRQPRVRVRPPTNASHRAAPRCAVPLTRGVSPWGRLTWGLGGPP
eukprot:496550-Prymnesium_polylepis.1